MQIEANTPASVPQANAKKRDDPKKVHDAAQQFESLLIGQMLKSVRESGSSWLGTGEDAASSSAIEMAEQEFAKAISARGGIGLAHLVETGMAQRAGSSAAPQKLSPPAPLPQKLNE